MPQPPPGFDPLSTGIAPRGQGSAGPWRLGARRARPLLLALTGLAGAGICFFATVITIFGGSFLGYRPDPDDLANYGLVMGAVAALDLIILLAAVLLLISTLVETLQAWRARRSLRCRQCGQLETTGMFSFRHRYIAGTDWEEITCPLCGFQWHIKV